MTYGSLFTGIGGIDRGLDAAGFRCRWQVENDPYAVKVLEKHWPTVKRYGDICSIDGSELEPVDLVCGGFPCQDLSHAGKRVGIEGTRSGLWFEYARIIGVLRPRFVLIENVPGLLVPGAMSRVVGELARLGYVGCWRSLRASEFGASHLRKRVFIVAYSPSGASLDLPGVRRALERQPGRGFSGNGSGHMADSAQQLHNGTGIAGPGRRREPANDGGYLADPINRLLQKQGRGPEGRDGAGPGSEEFLPHTNVTGLAQREREGSHDGALQPPGRPQSPGLRIERMQFAPGPSDPRWPAILRERPDLAPSLPSIRGVAPRLPNRLDGDEWMIAAMSNRTKRLGRLGNSVVPQIAEWIGGRILEFDKELTYG